MGFETLAMACDHLPRLPLEDSMAHSDFPVNQAIKKVLLAYIQYKKSTMIPRNDVLKTFVDHMHSTVCCSKTCQCVQFSLLASHYDGCRDAGCEICRPIRLISSADRVFPDLKRGKSDRLRISGKGDSAPSCGFSEAMQPLPKRLKRENTNPPCLPCNDAFCATAPSKLQPSFTRLPPLVQLPEYPISSNLEARTELLSKVLENSTITNMGMDIDLLPKLIKDSASIKEIGQNTKKVNTKFLSKLIENFSSAEKIGKDHFNNFSLYEKLAAGGEKGETKGRANAKRAELKAKTELTAKELNCRKEIKLESQKQGVSLIENFTTQQIRKHISSLRECINQDCGKKEAGNGMVNVDSKDSCQLCGAAKLSLAPAPIYCSSCCARIKCSATYYNTPEVNGIGHCLCSSCHNASRSQVITTSGISISKEKLIKLKNDDEPEEWWVQCDKCKCWQHQICALFNEKRNKKGKDFICPKCYLEELENGERKPPPVRTVLGAKDLPQTMLSDHLEQRLFMSLRKNRKEKARATGMNIAEIPEAKGLVVREVLSVRKLVKVNKQLLDVLQDENYPAEFPYKSKVILLFQNIEGADVCLFIMYVQEFGAECGQPNQRSVYISYLDSVKYFRPESETAASGEALRTVVYHEILVGYLEYCKKRGFATCYIWACPPTKGEDYILYCHPEGQKIPKPDKLRQWHKTMLQKAAKAGIVVELTNLYDQFFSTGKYNTKVTAAHLPYFDGDYWSGASEDMLKHIKQVNGESSKNMSKKTVSKRAWQAMGHTNPSGHAIKDIILMQKLGQNILPMKEDFIIAHLQFVCECCHRAILDKCRWSCRQCKSFQICGRCHDAKGSSFKDSTHTLGNGEKHSLCRIMMDDDPPDAGDKDVDIGNGLFEDRYNFLFFCQKNNYQFDTLRQAKHSSMMILYCLHNPAALLATTTTTSCPDISTSSIENREPTQKRKLSSELLELLLHAARCHSRCSDQNCHLMKKLFYHSRACTTRATGGCRHCKKTWFLLKLHARGCKDSDCVVPRCRDIKLIKRSLAKKPAKF